MPLTKSLKKLEKHKGSDKLHPKGRKFKQLNRANAREDRLSAQRKKHHQAADSKTVRMKFFQNCIASVTKPTYSTEETHVFIQEYLQQKQSQIDEMDAARRGNPKSNKQDLVQMSLDNDRKEYKIGMLAPDLSDVENVKRLVNWNGQLSAMTVIETIKLKEGDSGNDMQE